MEHITTPADLSLLSDAQTKKVVNVRATERMLSLLSRLKDEYGINMSESIRNGVALFFIAKQEEKKGRRLAFIDETGKVAAEVHPL